MICHSLKLLIMISKIFLSENMYVKNSLLEFDNDRFVRVTDGFIDIMKEKIILRVRLFSNLKIYEKT